MASTITALTTGTGGVVTTADTSGVLQFQTNNGTTALTLGTDQSATFSSTITGQSATFSSTITGKQSGLVLPYQYYQLNTAVVGANATGAQSIFGVGVTLSSSTVYEFEAIFTLYKTAGTTSHTVSIGFGGTATLNNIGYAWTEGAASAVNTFNGAGASDGNAWITSASATVLTVASTGATRAWICSIKGTVSVNAGGTFIPQYTLSAAPGGAYTTQIGSYIKFAPLGASGANINIGTWS